MRVKGRRYPSRDQQHSLARVPLSSIGRLRARSLSPTSAPSARVVTVSTYMHSRRNACVRVCAAHSRISQHQHARGETALGRDWTVAAECASVPTFTAGGFMPLPLLFAPTPTFSDSFYRTDPEAVLLGCSLIESSPSSWSMTLRRVLAKKSWADPLPLLFAPTPTFRVPSRRKRECLVPFSPPSIRLQTLK